MLTLMLSFSLSSPSLSPSASTSCSARRRASSSLSSAALLHHHCPERATNTGNANRSAAPSSVRRFDCRYGQKNEQHRWHLSGYLSICHWPIICSSLSLFLTVERELVQYTYATNWYYMNDMLNPNGLHMPWWNNDSKKQSPTLFTCTEKSGNFLSPLQLPMFFQLSERVGEKGRVGSGRWPAI